LLADPTIDAVSVCTANTSHAEISIAALKAGKHVLCEKPMATTLEDCEAMVKTARETGKFLMVGQNQRLARAHVKAKELIQEGLIGEIVSFRTTFGHGGPETWSIDPGKNVWFFDKNKAALGVMADLGIHKTDLIHFITGQTVVETTARLVTLDKHDASGNLISVDDNAFCIYRLSGGAMGTMTASWTHYGAEDNSTVFYGTKGIMRIYDDPEFSIKVTTREGDKILYQTDRIQTNDNQTKSGIIDAFVQSLVEDREPEISGAEVLKTMRVIFASIESSNKGCTVAIHHK
jgi:predicted dehydrogenase